MASLPDSGPLRQLAGDLRRLAVTVEGQRYGAQQATADTLWISRVATSTRTTWSWADGHARTGADELRAVATHLDRLAEAVDDLRAAMARAHSDAQDALRALAVPDADGDRALHPGLLRAELASMTPAGDPHWARVAGAPSVPLPELPPAHAPADPGAPAPALTVITDPARVRLLAGTWRDAALTIREETTTVATRAAGLPLRPLDAYGLPGSRTAQLLESVLDPFGSTRTAAEQLDHASESAVRAAAAIDGLGEGFGQGQGGAALLLEHFAALDTAAEGGDADGAVSEEDLRAAIDDASLPAAVRQAARDLLDDPGLWLMVQELDEGAVRGVPDGRIRAAALEDLIALRAHSETLYDRYDDLVELSDHPQGLITIEGLQAVAGDQGGDPALRAAAQFFAEHPQAMRQGGPPTGMSDVTPTLLGREDLQRILIASHAFDGRPDDAQSFLRTLPQPVDGGRGFPIDLLSDESVQSLANEALLAADGDLTQQVEAIANLPETSGGVRNALISAMYARMGAQLDAAMNGGLAGEPQLPGHSGMNWMVLAPWASNGVRDPITGDFRAFGFIPAPGGARQAAADGNQWIFNDIGTRYAAFLELYEDGAPPEPHELEAFLNGSFGDGDAEIRSAFAAYAEVPHTTDPVRRQELMFQGNVLIAVHEQEGAQPWLEVISIGPDAVATETIELRMGPRLIRVAEDLPPLATPNNLLQGRPFLDLDPGARSPHDLAPHALAGVELDDITGIDDGGFPRSLADMSAGGGGTTRPAYSGGPFPLQLPVDNDPDTDAGTGARAWTDRHERMWNIVKLFEQSHTDLSLYDPSVEGVGFDSADNAWLDPATGLR